VLHLLSRPVSLFASFVHVISVLLVLCTLAYIYCFL